MIDALRNRFKLSPMEAEMLARFIARPGLHHKAHNSFNNLFCVRKNRIHRKLGREVIKNQWGEGYYLDDDDRAWLKQECGLS